ncbi:alpha-galactosidase A precursor [Sclerotinia borealis F-4128]|uniref:Alpha-galactosidase A n=1 Tax=Sclerotinia borealis (strain F-4128) TaxID=1432307 RepID=W9C1Z4_SCLBF|nr:alpha-galactosidase A precursor [Sclerotinia borealis F-4128]
MLVNNEHFKYITIDPEIYEVDDMCFPPYLISKLPPFPAGDWNYGRISRTAENSMAFFAETSKKDFPSIKPLWHTKSYDYLSFELEQLNSNVFMASSPLFEQPIIAKFARFEWEIGYYIAETQVYSWINGCGIGPEFLGYLTEEGRVIGFLIENVEGRHATISDLPACKAAVERLHDLGIIHGDLNKYNFLISEGRAVLIDFETAQRSEDSEAIEKEMEGLELQLLDMSGRGGVCLEDTEQEDD